MSKARKRALGFAVIAAGLLAVVVGIVQPNPFADTRSYWAEFDDAQGLGAIDRDVRVAGVKVGTIGAVERDGDDVRVELILNQGIPIHRDARANMRPHTLFEGSNFVDLLPGSPSAPQLQVGATIPRSQTSDYVTLDKALRVLRPSIRDNLRELAKVGSKTVRGQAVGGVQETLKHGPALSAALAPAARAAQGPGRYELAGAIGGMSRTVDALASQQQHLIPLVRRLNRTTAGLGVDAGRPLDATLTALPGALRELREAGPALTATIDRLDRLSGELTPALPDLADALKQTTPVLSRAIPVLRRATPLVRDARLIAARLAEAKGGLITMFDLLPETLSKFDTALAVVNAPTKLGAPSYRQLVAGGFSGLDGVFRSYQTAAQNPDAPGHTLRISTYIHPGALGGVGGLLGSGSALGNGARPARPAPCSEVRQVSARAARQLRATGGCR